MARLGMDVEVVESVAKELTSAAHALRSITSALDRSLRRAQEVWIGRDASALVGDWQRQHRHLDQLAQAIDDYARQAQRQAAEQRRASESTGAVGGAPAPRRHDPWRRDEPATEQQVNDIATRLKVIGQSGIKDHYPQAYARAEAWGKELRNNPNPSAAEVAAFQKYCYLLSLASGNRSKVHDFATIAADNFDDMSKAQVEAVYGTIKAGVPGGSTTDLSTLSVGHAAGLVAEGAAKGAAGWAGAEMRGAVVEKLTPEMVPGVVSAYDREAGAFLADVYTRAHAVPTSSVSTGSSIMSAVADAVACYKPRPEALRPVRAPHVDHHRAATASVRWAARRNCGSKISVGSLSLSLGAPSSRSMASTAERSGSRAGSLRSRLMASMSMTTQYRAVAPGSGTCHEAAWLPRMIRSLISGAKTRSLISVTRSNGSSGRWTSPQTDAATVRPTLCGVRLMPAGSRRRVGRGPMAISRRSGRSPPATGLRRRCRRCSTPTTRRPRRR